jgi:GTP-binding protein EngB required for normal cell division
MTNKETLNKIRNSIGKDDLNSAVKSLLDILANEKRKNEIILIQGRYTESKKKYDLDLIKFEEYGRVKNQIRDSLLSIIDDIEEFISQPQIIEKEKEKEKDAKLPIDEKINSEVEVSTELKSARYNVMLIGKIGVGKTSLINYLYGKDVGLTGVGMSITTGFNPIDITVNNQNIRIYDTEGLSAGSAHEWKKNLVQFLSEHGLETPASNWLHSIFYCFHVGGSRIERFEIDIIKELIKQNYKITIVFSKADQGGEEDIELLESTLESHLNEKLTIVPICSIEGKKRLDGTRITRFGKENLEKQLYLDFWKSICTRLPLRCEYIAIQLIEIWEREQEREIRRLVRIEDDLNAIVYRLKSETDNFTKTLKAKIINLVAEEIELTMKLYDAFSNALGYPVDKLNRLSNMNLEVRFASYEKATIMTVAAQIFDLEALFESFDNYSEKISREMQKLNITPKSRENELLSNLHSVVSALKYKIKGSDSDKNWAILLKALSEIGVKMSKDSIKNRSLMGLKHIVAESLIEISPYWDIIEYDE